MREYFYYYKATIKTVPSPMDYAKTQEVEGSAVVSASSAKEAFRIATMSISSMGSVRTYSVLSHVIIEFKCLQ